MGPLYVERIPGVAHVVKKDSFLSKIHFNMFRSFRPESLDTVPNRQLGWENEQVYVNHFYEISGDVLVLRSTTKQSGKVLNDITLLVVFW